MCTDTECIGQLHADIEKIQFIHIIKVLVSVIKSNGAEKKTKQCPLLVAKILKEP